MFKSYYQQHSSLSSDEVYEGLLSYGMFSDNLPSFLQSIDFFNWCKAKCNPTCREENTLDKKMQKKTNRTHTY